MKKPRSSHDIQAEAAALRRLVDLVSHRAGAALSVMEQTGVTLPQALLLARVERTGGVSISTLASNSTGSAPAMSQMVDRLVRQNLLLRIEDPLDRRRKTVSLSAAGTSFLRNLERARTLDYAAGLALLQHSARAELARAVEHALIELTGDSR